MGFKFKAKVDSKEMKKSLNKYRDEFIKQTSNELQGLILNEIENGRSPVQGFGRFAKYSDSYLAQINMKSAFRTLPNGKIIAWNKLSSKELKSFRASKQAVKQNKQIGELIEHLNIKFLEYNKKPRPVNLTLSGKLLSSLKITPKESDIEITFTDELFDVHNKQGAGKSQTVRRMLPTNKGEKFSRSITLRFAEIASLVAKKIFG
jgi:hypothetical protein